jgi:hypothetical protein
VEMAKLNGVYIIFCFAGSNAGGAGRLDATSADYNDYTAWYEDVMTEYSGEKAIGIWDLYNEAYSDANKVAWWNSNGGYAAYVTWRHDVSVNAQAHAGTHLIDMDSVPTSYSQAAWNASFADHFDLCDWHGYWSAESTYLVSDRANWSAALGRPWIMGECALNAPIVPPYWSTIWMTLYALPDYPITPVTMNLIPSMPSGGGTGGGSGGNVTIPIISELLSGPGGNYMILFIIGAGVWFGTVAGRKRRR